MSVEDAVRAAETYVAATTTLADESFWPLIMFTNTNLFMWHIEAFKASRDPVQAFVEIFDRATAFLDNAVDTGIAGGHFPKQPPAEQPRGDERFISAMFSDVWVDLSDDVYFDETYDFIVQRFARNGIDAAELFADKVVADAGCGSGKFAAGIARLGARRVIGLDIGERGLAFAREQAKKVPYGDRLEYHHGSAYDLPLEDASVDMVWSNGVVHLTDNYDGCIADFARVIKPGGRLYLYVNGRFGLFELLFDTLRRASVPVPRRLFQHFLLSVGINTGRVYWMMCAFYATYQWRAQTEVEALLEREGFTDLRQLTRGMDFDQIEQVFAGIRYADIKYGEAQLKYLARRAG